MKKACSVCLTNCLRLHGAEEEDEDANTCLRCALRISKVAHKVANVQDDRHPSFLQKITASTMSILKLPVPFGAAHTERLGERVILEGPGKDQWRVDLDRNFRSFSITFGKGWKHFVADHGLQIGDQLSFSLTEKSYLQVEVYDGFGVQKRRALKAINASLVQEKIKNDALKDHHSVDVSPTARQEEHDKPEKATQSLEQLLADLTQSRVVSAPENDMEIDEPAGSGDSARPAMESAETDKGGQLLPQQTLVSGQVISQRRSVTEVERVQALQGAHALKLVNRNTSIVMTKSHVYKGFLLPIPKRFAKDVFPSENKEITLLNKSGHKWPAKWLASPGGLSAGWRRFSLDHRLEEHDVCVFELVDKADYTLIVHIFRVLGGSEEDPGLYTSASTPLRRYQSKRNTMKSSLTVSNHPKAHCIPRKGQVSINKRNKCTWETSSRSKNHKRKLYLQDDEAPRSLAKARRLGDSEDHQNLEKLVNHVSVDARAGNGPVNKVALNCRLEPRASCEAETNPTSTPQGLGASCIDLENLGKHLLSRKGLGDIDPPEARAAGAYKVHQQISNFADVSVPAGGRRTPPSVESRKGRKNNQGQLYRVVCIYKGRSAGNNTDYLAEIEGYTEGSSTTTLDRDDGTGFWWIPSDLFEWDMLSCRI